jgi:hypothetical protein
MRENIFRKPSVRELFQLSEIEIPKRITKKYIEKLINEETIIPFKGDYKEAVVTLDNFEFSDKFILFPSEFRITNKEANYGIKSLDELVKIDSQKVLRDVSKNNGVPANLTNQFLENNKIWPYTLIKQAMKYADIKNPPMGYYWKGEDNHFRATTWLNCVEGSEMEIMKRKGDFYGEITDKKPYGRNLRVNVNSRTEEDKTYGFTLSRLPMHKRGDKTQYSNWINLSHNSPDPDASYKGEEHEKRKFPIVFWSSPAIFSFYEAMTFVTQYPGLKQFRINPFPIPTDEKTIDFVDKLRLKSFILDKEAGTETLRVLNKAEINKFIGARTTSLGYDKSWHHWGKKDLSYLYKAGKYKD